VLPTDQEKLPVSIFPRVGIWMTLLNLLISDPAWHPAWAVRAALSSISLDAPGGQCQSSGLSHSGIFLFLRDPS